MHLKKIAIAMLALSVSSVHALTAMEQHILEEAPPHINGTQEQRESHSAYRIIYTQSWSYAVCDAGCRSIEQKSRTAFLDSSAGLCNIDLDAKTASGQCDRAVHRKAKMLPLTVTAVGR
jgi:hypothetical protein